MLTYECVREAAGVALWRHESGLFAVTGIDRASGQVSSIMACDMPTGGGKWVARMTDAGIDYVSSLHHRSTAMRFYKRLMSQRRVEWCMS